MPTISTLTLPQPSRPVGERDGSIFFIGTATTLIRLGGFTLLTDPNFLHAGEHAHLGYGMTSKRLTDPAIDIEALPPLDLCLLSHYHGDHWDQVAAEKLPQNLPVVTTHAAAKEIRKQGFKSTFGLDHWDRFSARKGDEWLHITALPARHGPPVVDFALPDVNGTMLEWGEDEFAPRFRLYISGDTLVYDGVKEIPGRYPDIDLALLHLGGTRVLGVLVTMDDKQGIEIIHLLKPQHIVPIHYNDYPVFESPIEDFLSAAEKEGLAAQVHFLEHGETYSFPLH